MKIRWWILASMGVLLAGCEAVPDLVFDDGGTSPDAADAGCPVPCLGPYCNAANCLKCMMMCAPTDVCCTKSASNAVCTSVCR